MVVLLFVFLAEEAILVDEGLHQFEIEVLELLLMELYFHIQLFDFFNFFLF